MDFESLYKRTRTGSLGCDSYYCSTCGGQAKRVEKVLQHTNTDDVYQYLMGIDIAEYLQRDTNDERREFLQHLLNGADWSKSVLSAQKREAINSHWREKVKGDEYRQLDKLFEFTDPDAYYGREDHFDIETVMNEHGGQCKNRDGFHVRIVSVENPGGFPILGAVLCGLTGEEEEEYRTDGSLPGDWWGDLVMPDEEA